MWSKKEEERILSLENRVAALESALCNAFLMIKILAEGMDSMQYSFDVQSIGLMETVDNFVRLVIPPNDQWRLPKKPMRQ